MPASPTPPPCTPKCKRNFRRIATIVAIALLTPPAIVGGVAWYYSRPERLAHILEEALGDNIHGSVHIDRAHISWRGTLKVENLRIGLANKTGPYAQVLDAPLATIRLSRRELLKFNPLVLAIDMESPVAHLVENPATNRVNWSGLGIKDTGTHRAPPPLPRFTLRHGQISFEQLNPDAKSTTILAVWELDGTLTPRPNTTQAAQVQLTAKRPDGKIATFSGGFDLAAGSAEGELKGGCLRPEFALFLPRESRTWLRMLSAQGEIPLLSAKVDWADKIQIHAAHAQVQELSIHPNIRPLLGKLEKTPAGEIMAAACEQLSFDRINGEAVVADNLLRLPDLRATAHGEALGFGTVEAKLSGQLNLVGHNEWSLAFTTESFVLADKIPILEVFPDVRTIYQRFNPAGTFRVSGRAEAKGLTAVPEVEARVELIDAKANFASRPYPVEHLKGTLVATLDSIVIENLRGEGVHGGSVTVSGKVAPLTDAAGADIHVGLIDVPYGEHILGALGELTGNAVRGFLSAPATEQLRARHLPAPTPGGMLNATLNITRALGEGGHWGILADVNPAGLQVILPQWPYPMKVTEGRVVASDTQVKVTGIKAVGPTGGTVEMEAQAGESGPAGHWGWSVKINRSAVPADDWFYAALPPNAEHAARQVGVTGVVAADGTLSQDPGNAKDSELHIDLHGKVKDGEANPFDAGYKLEKVALDMTLHAEDFTINQADASHGGATFSAQEKVTWGKAFSNLLTVSAKDLPFEVDLAKLAPPDSTAQKRIQEAFAKWKIEGQGDGTFRWATDAKDAQTFGVEISPHAFSMVSPVGAEERLELSNMTGHATIGEDGIRLHAIGGDFEDGSATADGMIAQAKDGSADITLDLTGKTDLYSGMLPDTLIALLPPSVVVALENTNASGHAVCTGGKLRLKNGDTDFKAQMEVKKLNFELGLPLRQTYGSANLHTASKAGQTTTTADLALTSAEIYGRKITDGKAKVAMDADGAWHMAGFQALLAGGSLNGSIAGGAGAWAMDADLVDAAFEGIQSPATWNGAEGKGGLLSAHARLRSHGEGFVNLAGDGNFDLQLADLGAKNSQLALIETLNLVRSNEPISQASGHFIAHGNTLFVDDAVMSSAGGLKITGRGTVTLPQNKLDLRLKTHNQAGTFRAKVAKLFQPLTNEILGLRVTGTLDNPEATADSFATLRSMLRELLPGADEAAVKVKNQVRDKLKRK